MDVTGGYRELETVFQHFQNVRPLSFRPLASAGLSPCQFRNRFRTRRLAQRSPSGHCSALPICHPNTITSSPPYHPQTSRHFTSSPLGSTVDSSWPHATSPLAPSSVPPLRRAPPPHPPASEWQQHRLLFVPSLRRSLGLRPAPPFREMERATVSTHSAPLQSRRVSTQVTSTGRSLVPCTTLVATSLLVGFTATRTYTCPDPFLARPNCCHLFRVADTDLGNFSCFDSLQLHK